MANKRTPLERVIRDHLKSQSEVARIVGVTPQAVGDNIRNKRKVPAEWCIPLERATNGAITRHDLRPDIYPVENGAAA